MAEAAQGFNNLVRRENTAWWRSARWLILAVVATAALAGFTALVLFVVPQVAAAQGEPLAAAEQLEAGINSFFGLAFLGAAVATVILTQDAIIGERQSGTAEWVLSKPVSRSAYVLSKLLAHGAGILVALILIPCAVGYALFAIKVGGVYPVAGYVAAVGVLALHTLFYLVLSLLMGVLTEQRGVLLAVTLGSALGGLVLVNLLGSVALVTPWALTNVAVALASAGELPPALIVPVVSPALLTAAALIVALVRFNRVEL
ncbi:MAG: ABC transporter permease subunit [Chloroflexi bacterium]|nr:ABC transporter permease subunit [Chloroflexota bacterium]